MADKIRRLSLTTVCLWRFLGRAVGGSVVAAISAAGHLSDRIWQRIWMRFDLAQSTIRTALYERCPPPQLPPESSLQPAAHGRVGIGKGGLQMGQDIAAFPQTMRTSAASTPPVAEPDAFTTSPP